MSNGVDQQEQVPCRTHKRQRRQLQQQQQQQQVVEAQVEVGMVCRRRQTPWSRSRHEVPHRSQDGGHARSQRRVQPQALLCVCECIIRLINKHEPKATALVFKTGKVVVTGSKSNASVDYACKTFARILSKLDNGSGGSAPNINFNLDKDRKVQNMVATTDVGFPIRLEGMVASDQASYCNYEPELFPGLIYRLNQPKICVLIFVSGKVVLTGAKSVEQLEAGFKAVYPMLLQFKKATVLLQTSASASTEPYLEPSRKKSKT
eukprot:g14064.t2